MDSRLYFVLGDLASNTLVAAIIGWISWLIIDPGWNMFAAMILMMLAGMLVATFLWLPLGVLFGAMEVMLPLMFNGMLSGMVVGMWAAMRPLSGGGAFWLGAACGLVGILAIWLLNSRLRGITSYQETGNG